MRAPLFASLVLALAGLVAAAPARAVQVSIGPGAGLAGQTVDVPVSVSNVTGLGIRSAQFEFTYNSNIIDVTDVVESGALAGTAGWGDAQFHTEVVSGSTRRLRVAGAGVNALAGSGALMFVRFVVNPAQLTSTSTGLTFGAFDFNEGTPVDTTTNGLFTVNPTPVITVNPNTATIVRGTTQAFTVSGSVTNPVSWFTTNAAIATITSGGVLTGVAPGTVRVFAVDNAGRRDTTDSDVFVRGMGLTVGTVPVLVNNVVSLPITVTSLTGLGIRSGQVTLFYTGSRLTATSVTTPPGTLLNGYGPVGFSSDDGTCTIDFAGASDLNGSGVLCYVTMQAGAFAGGYGVGVSQALFNEALPALTTNGVVNISALPTITISPDNVTLLAGQTQAFTLSGSPTAPITWSVLDPTLGTISPGGLFTAMKGGVTQIQAVDNVGATDLNTAVTIYDFKATLGTVTCPPGATVLLPLETDRPLGALDIHSVQAVITYPTTQITAVSYPPGGLVGAWAPNVLATFPLTGRFQLAAAGAAALTNGASTIFALQFTVSPTAPVTDIPITLTSLMCNEGAPIPQLVNGVIRVRTTTDVVEGGGAAFALRAAEPNPVRGSTRLAFVVPASGAAAHLAVYGADGRRIRTLVDGPLGAGPHSAVWDASDELGRRVPAGLYFARLEWNGRTLSRKLAVVR